MRFIPLLLVFSICVNLLAETAPKSKNDHESSQFSLRTLMASILPVGLAFYISKNFWNKPAGATSQRKPRPKPNAQDHRTDDFQPRTSPIFLGTFAGAHPNSGEFLVMPPIVESNREAQEIRGLRGAGYFRYPHLYRTLADQEAFDKPQNVDVLVLGGGLTAEDVPAQVFELYALYRIFASQLQLTSTMTLVDLSPQVLNPTGRYNRQEAQFVIDQDSNLGPEATRLRRDYFLPILRTTPDTMPHEVRTIQANFRDWQPAAQTYDRIVATGSLIYAFDGLTEDQGQQLLGTYIRALRPGGHLYVDSDFIRHVFIHHLVNIQPSVEYDLANFEEIKLQLSTYENPTVHRGEFFRPDLGQVAHGVPQIINGPAGPEGRPSIGSSDIVLIKRLN